MYSENRSSNTTGVGDAEVIKINNNSWNHQKNENR